MFLGDWLGLLDYIFLFLFWKIKDPSYPCPIIFIVGTTHCSSAKFLKVMKVATFLLLITDTGDIYGFVYLVSESQSFLLLLKRQQ